MRQEVPKALAVDPSLPEDEGRQVLGDYRGTVVVNGYTVYECLARDGPGFVLAHCWAHTKRKFETNATDWPTRVASSTR